MGLTHVTVTLKANPTTRKHYTADFLVDTGATHCLAPAKQLRTIGIKPMGKTSYELADGRLQEYDFGIAVIRFLGDITAGRVIFGPDDVEPLLGVTALESVGITVDPRNQTLKRLPAISLKKFSALSTAQARAASMRWHARLAGRVLEDSAPLIRKDRKRG